MNSALQVVGNGQREVIDDGIVAKAVKNYHLQEHHRRLLEELFFIKIFIKK